MPANFDGFSQDEVHFMNAAYQKMKAASGAAKRDLMGGKLDNYRKWFDGTGGAAHIMKVASIVNEVDSAINSRPITFAKLDRPGVNVNTNGLCAYVFLVRSGQFVHHVGSGMRILVVWKTHATRGLGYLAQTMYHELTHKVGSTTDLAYDRGACAGFAKSNPGSAVRNAENYNLFLGEYL
jgi:hypothetical protein